MFEAKTERDYRENTSRFSRKFPSNHINKLQEKKKKDSNVAQASVIRYPQVAEMSPITRIDFLEKGRNAKFEGEV